MSMLRQRVCEVERKEEKRWRREMREMREKDEREWKEKVEKEIREKIRREQERDHTYSQWDRPPQWDHNRP